MKTLFYIFFSLISCNMLWAQQKKDSLKSLTNKYNIKENRVFKCHPNPVENELFILGINKIKTIEFINVLGKRAALYHYNKSIIKLDVSQLKKGIYFLQVIDEKNMAETKKLVVK